MTNQRANYQLAAITLGMILLGGTILGSAPFAFADDHDDKKAKLKAKLKQLIEKIRDEIKNKKPDRDRGDKCKGTKYENICDDSAPSVGIKFPDNKAKFPPQLVTIVVKAKDGQTAVKKVEVFVNGVPIGEAASVGGDLYEIDFDFIDKGRYVIKATATDLVDNIGEHKIRVRVI